MSLRQDIYMSVREASEGARGATEPFCHKDRTKSTNTDLNKKTHTLYAEKLIFNENSYP